MDVVAGLQGIYKVIDKTKLLPTSQELRKQAKHLVSHKYLHSFTERDSQDTHMYTLNASEHCNVTRQAIRNRSTQWNISMNYTMSAAAKSYKNVLLGRRNSTLPRVQLLSSL